jgi:hypothetical protein
MRVPISWNSIVGPLLGASITGSLLRVAPCGGTTIEGARSDGPLLGGHVCPLVGGSLVQLSTLLLIRQP